MADTFQAQILTPDGKRFEGSVQAVQVPGIGGSFEMRVDHAPIISTLDIGRARVISSDSKYHYFAISGGFVEMNNNKMTLLAEAAERVEDIDIERAEEAKNRAIDELMKRQKDKAEMEKALRRAENRLRLKEQELEGKLR
jgi:F-type H+-transporting ATPase subunit epsilon